jgi:hypothetical protein
MSFASEMAVRLVPQREAREGAFRGGPGMAALQFGWWVSRDGFNGVGTNYSSFVPSPPRRKKPIYFNALKLWCGGLRGWASASKICDSLNYCAAHKN